MKLRPCSCEKRGLVCEGAGPDEQCIMRKTHPGPSFHCGKCYHHVSICRCGNARREVPSEDALTLARFPLKPTPDDVVVLPSHYSRFAIEPVYFCATNGLTFIVSNAIKYIVRAPYKHPNPVEDMSKAIRCIVMETKRLIGDPDFWKPYKSKLSECLKEEFSYVKK